MKEKEIAEVLRNKYHPVAVLLHGSRAVGEERQHSDWDIIMLFDDVPRKGYREQIEGEDVEWRAYKVPTEDDSIIDTFDLHLQFAKVLWEANGEGTALLQRASAFYAKGAQLSEDDIRRAKQFIEHKLRGMEDDIENPSMFLRHLGVFFNNAVNLWFEVLHNKYSKPFYLAISEIKEQDPQYAEQLDALSSKAPNQEKIEAGRWIIHKLFP